MNDFIFFVEGIPRPKGSFNAFYNQKINKQVFVNANPRTKSWQTLISFKAKEKFKRKLFEKAVELKLMFYFEKPKKPKNKTYPIVKPDLDKLQRTVLDALQGIVFKDDCQVISIEANKRFVNEYHPNAGVNIYISLNE